MKKTKIVCTLGPASSSEEVIRKMLNAGMDVARFNFSHGTHEDHKKMMDMFRCVRDRIGVPAAVMLDTKGPEIRLGNFEGDCVIIKDGSEFTLTTEPVLGTTKQAEITYKKLPKEITEGQKILIDDGYISMRVVRTTNTEIFCKVVHGGALRNHKSINVPSVHLSMPYLSEQDKSDLLFGIENNVDFVSASFARNKEDMIALRKFLDYNGGHDIRIIAKIENTEGIENFDSILKEVDGIMVARGDMGVEVAYERLPGLQKQFIRRCYQAGKVAITATQMLESMISSPSPTRAEITDVANAVFDGTSAVMLSGESAMGTYPVLAIEVMANIVTQAECDAFKMNAYDGLGHDIDFTDITNAICDATCTTARDINAKAIIAVTNTGTTARRMSKFRPYEPIVAATPYVKTFHQLALSWGVYPVMAKMQITTDDLFLHAVDCAKQNDIVAAGDRVVITAGIPLGVSGGTNTLKVQEV